MSVIYLIRHGQAAASFTDDLDPGLDDTGRQQAQLTAEKLHPLAPARLVSSPLRRAKETAMPLAELMGKSVAIEARIAEIPSPGLDLQQRGAWLQGIMRGRISDLSTELLQWRENMIQCLLSVKEDTAFFSHFVAINLLVGAAESRDEVLVFRPGNGSITHFETDGQQLRLIKRGDEAETRVN
ncbi:MAG: histidine phosphatase family protein [Gammaproteobacteria bacterium]|nr:histidine phosphatase family protein [Gammaproteobacteria bacterium]